MAKIIIKSPTRNRAALSWQPYTTSTLLKSPPDPGPPLGREPEIKGTDIDKIRFRCNRYSSGEETMNVFDEAGKKYRIKGNQIMKLLRMCDFDVRFARKYGYLEIQNVNRPWGG